MSAATHTGAYDIRRPSAQLRDWLSFAVVLIVVALLDHHLLDPVIDLVREDERGLFEIANRLGREAAAAGPAIFYACALWALRNTVARLAAGATFEAPVLGGLSAVGRDLGWGAAFAILITPTILEWTDGSPGGFGFDLEIASVVIGLLGCALTLLAGLLSRAAAQEDDLRHII